jgi:hypothetical protein
MRRSWTRRSAVEGVLRRSGSCFFLHGSQSQVTDLHLGNIYFNVFALFRDVIGIKQYCSDFRVISLYCMRLRQSWHSSVADNKPLYCLKLSRWLCAVKCFWAITLVTVEYTTFWRKFLKLLILIGTADHPRGLRMIQTLLQIVITHA